MPETRAVNSDWGGRTVPSLMIVGLIALAIAGTIRFFVQPPPGPRR